jgi:RHS repeat-associated protein
MASVVSNGSVTLASFTYNNRGQRAQMSGGGTSDYAYDAVGRLSSITHDLSGTTNDVSYGLNAYNPASQITQSSISNDSYAYTGAYNVNRNYAVNGLNQYVSAGPANFSYDANGNLTSDGTTTYVYDVENRLVSASGASGTATLRYDPLGRLYETNGSTSGITRYLHDGDELVAEYNASGTMLRRYVHGSSVDDPIVAYEGSGLATPRWLRSNHLGSVVALSDTSGTLTAKNSYDEWGIPSNANASIAAGGRFQYTGQAWIPELGLYYYKARFYSPTLGRFMQTDPVGYESDINLYAYVTNDPINKVDPDGLSDLNLFRPSDRLYQGAEDFEPDNEVPEIYTITAHWANPNGGARDGRPNGSGLALTPEQLLKVAMENKGNKYTKGTTIFLLICNAAHRNYASKLAELSGGRVIAATGLVTMPSTRVYEGETGKPYESDGRPVNMRFKAGAGQFVVFSPSGKTSEAFSKATYNPKTGVITFKSEAVTGSLVERRKKINVR